MIHYSYGFKHLWYETFYAVVCGLGLIMLPIYMGTYAIYPVVQIKDKQQ